MGPFEHIAEEFESTYDNFLSRMCIRKCKKISAVLFNKLMAQGTKQYLP